MKQRVTHEMMQSFPKHGPGSYREDKQFFTRYVPMRQGQAYEEYAVCSTSIYANAYGRCAGEPLRGKKGEMLPGGGGSKKRPFEDDALGDPLMVGGALGDAATPPGGSGDPLAALAAAATERLQVQKQEHRKERQVEKRAHESQLTQQQRKIEWQNRAEQILQWQKDMMKPALPPHPGILPQTQHVNVPSMLPLENVNVQAVLSPHPLEGVLPMAVADKVTVTGTAEPLPPLGQPLGQPLMPPSGGPLGSPSLSLDPSQRRWINETLRP